MATNKEALESRRVANVPDKPQKKKKQQTVWKLGRGSAVVRIYLTPHGGQKYFTLSYWFDGKRKRQVFKKLKEAKEEASIALKDLSKADAGSAGLTKEERASYQRAVALLEAIGVPLELAAAEYADARKRLGPVPLSRAVDYYMQRHPVHIEPKRVEEVVEELLKIKRDDKLSARYLKQLEYDLKRFTNKFAGIIEQVRGHKIDEWLRELGVGPRTRNNLRNSIQVLFNFAIARKYLPKDHDEIDAIPLAKDSEGVIEIFRPEEMAELLGVASDAQIPFLTIGAFAGVRHAELQRLTWDDIRFDAGVIEIRAGKAKTASRRVIPLVPNLLAWLKNAPRNGKLCPYANMVIQFVDLTRRVNEWRREKWAKSNGITGEQLRAAEKRAREQMKKWPKDKRRSRKSLWPGADTAEEEDWTPFQWKHNALRHSFISYRVADVQNVHQVALEAGNSPQMIFKHYRELVLATDAKAWFALTPDSVVKRERKIVPLAEAA
jgi:integrase